MNQRDHLYQVQKSENDADRQRFKKVKHEMGCMLKTSYNNYLDSLVGIVNDSLSSDSFRPANKKFFSFLKNCCQDSQGSVPLMKEGQLVTDNVIKANLLNEQFQSVFTPNLP